LSVTPSVQQLFGNVSATLTFLDDDLAGDSSLVLSSGVWSFSSGICPAFGFGTSTVTILDDFYDFNSLSDITTVTFTTTCQTEGVITVTANHPGQSPIVQSFSCVFDVDNSGVRRATLKPEQNGDGGGRATLTPLGGNYIVTVDVHGLTPITNHSIGLADFDGCMPFFFGPSFTTDTRGGGAGTVIINQANFMSACGDQPSEVRIVKFPAGCCGPAEVVLKGNLNK
jgi:hypothetical protein